MHPRHLFGIAVALVLTSPSQADPEPQLPGLGPIPDASVTPEVLRPRLQSETCGRLEYPVFALANHLEGRVRVRFDLDETGRVTGMLIVRSSGHPALDSATLAAARTCQFRPALLKSRGVSFATAIDFQWRLDSASPGQPASDAAGKTPAMP